MEIAVCVFFKMYSYCCRLDAGEGLDAPQHVIVTQLTQPWSSKGTAERLILVANVACLVTWLTLNCTQHNKHEITEQHVQRKHHITVMVCESECNYSVWMTLQNISAYQCALQPKLHASTLQCYWLQPYSSVLLINKYLVWLICL